MTEIPYEIKRSKRKSLTLSIDRKGILTVKAPLWVSDAEIRETVDRKMPWIQKHLKQLEKVRNEMQNIPVLTETQRKDLTKKAALVLSPRVERFAEQMGVSYEKLSFRTQKTRWGSCNSKKHISLNALLLLAPEWVQDYIIVHELCHLKQMNHSARFWAEVEKVFPDRQAANRWLRENGKQLLARLPERIEENE